MGLLDAILEHDRARRAGQYAAVPTTGGRRIVCLTCTELVSGPASVASRLGLEDEQVLVVAVPGARVPRADGDVARAVALAAGAAGGTMGGAEVLVLGHDPCVFRAPSFAVPGPAPQGESQPTAGDLVRASVAQLRASPWMARTNVQAILADATGRLEGVRIEASSAGHAGVSGSLGGGPAGAFAPSGPVSFFGAAGAAPSLSAGAPPPPFGAPSSLVPPGAARSAASSPGAPAGSLGGAAGPATLLPAGAIRWDAPTPVGLAPPGGGAFSPGAAGGFSSLGSPGELGMPSAPVPQAAAAAMPTIGPMPTVGPMVIATPAPEALEAPRFTELARAMEQMIDTPAPGRTTPPPPPPPKPAPSDRAGRAGHRQQPARPPAQTPTPPPPASPAQGGSSGDDPFKRAEEILEKLRREKRR